MSYKKATPIEWLFILLKEIKRGTEQPNFCLLMHYCFTQFPNGFLEFPKGFIPFP